jgi:multidrug resistance efflux pump
MRAARRIWPLTVLLAAGSASVACDLHGKPAVERSERAPSPGAARDGRPPPEPAHARAGADAVVAPGVVEPWGDAIALAAQEPGWIVRVLAAEGQRVEAGQTLAQLEDSAQRHAVALARAELDEAAAALAKLERGATAEELREARAQRSAAAVRAKLARTEADRAARIREAGAAPEADADRAEADARAAAALAEVAEARVQAMERGARVEDRESGRARHAAARARLELAEAALRRRAVVAPGPATVLLSRFHAGELFEPSRGPLFVLGDVSRLQVRLEVDEIDASALQVGAACALHSDGGEVLGRGVVVRLAPRMGRRSLPTESPTDRTDVRVREVFVEVGASPALLPGQRVWGHAARTTRTALQTDGEGSSARAR